MKCRHQQYKQYGLAIRIKMPTSTAVSKGSLLPPWGLGQKKWYIPPFDRSLLSYSYSDKV
jgi:hypothetical protein